ncbi:AlpA family phage regulatory protein [Pseudomonas sp. ICMP 10191]|uniref:helix-turn-helix transcriptional regulator n=1 Tax=Pseudomonas sp. ICMP 10191 TaxID=1198294 RepID=UPI0009FB31E5
MRAFVPSKSASALIRLLKVVKLTGVSASKVYQMISTGEFPCLVKLGGRAVTWGNGGGGVAAYTNCGSTHGSLAIPYCKTPAALFALGGEHMRSTINQYKSCH